PCSRRRSTTLRRSSPRTGDWDKSATGPPYPRAVDRIPEPSTMDKDHSCLLASTKKTARKTERPFAEPKLFPLCPSVSSVVKIYQSRKHRRRPNYSAAKNLRMRSSPRSSSAFEVAYETRMCSLVPKPSPGTVATCASRNNRPATSDADFSPPRPRKDEIFG